MNNLLPALELVTHNAVAVLLGVPLLIAISQLIVAVILQIATRVLRTSIFEGVTAEDRAALRRRVQRRALLIVLALSAMLLVGALVASYRGLRAMDLAKNALTWTRGQDFAVLRMRLLKGPRHSDLGLCRRRDRAGDRHRPGERPVGMEPVLDPARGAARGREARSSRAARRDRPRRRVSVGDDD